MRLRSLVAVVTVTVLLGCTAGPPSGGRTPQVPPASAPSDASPPPSASETPQVSLTSAPPGASPTPSSGYVVTRSRVSSTDRLAELIRRATGFRHVVVLGIGAPRSLTVWARPGDSRAETRYRVGSETVSVFQNEGPGLPSGRSIRVRGRWGVVKHRVWYWVERGFTLALEPGSAELARSLRWVASA
jgi:hypothetical protein